MKDWPNVPDVTGDPAKDVASITNFLQYISRVRDDDITESDQLPSIYMAGRKVGKIPTSSTDILATDRVGDFNYDDSYYYIFTPGVAWRRIALGVW